MVLICTTQESHSRATPSPTRPVTPRFHLSGSSGSPAATPRAASAPTHRQHRLLLPVGPLAVTAESMQQHYASPRRNTAKRLPVQAGSASASRFGASGLPITRPMLSHSLLSERQQKLWVYATPGPPPSHVLRSKPRWQVRHALMRVPIVVDDWGGAIAGKYPKPLSYDPNRRLPPYLDAAWGRPPPEVEKPEPIAAPGEGWDGLDPDLIGPLDVTPKSPNHYGTQTAGTGTRRGSRAVRAASAR